MNNLLRYICLLLGVFLISSCSEEFMNFDGSGIDYEEGIPVEIFANMSDNDFTRGVADSKKTFVTDDVIHVEAVFYDEHGNEINKPDYRYKTFKMKSNGDWEQVGNVTMKWPAHAKKGKFKAYYVKNFQDALEKADQHRKMKLGDLTDDSDPLIAEKEGEWGQKINLTFKHLCTHLTFKNLEPDVTDYFWLINKNSGENFHNGFVLWITGNNELKLDFISIPDMDFKKDKTTRSYRSAEDDTAGDEEGDDGGENTGGDDNNESTNEDSNYGLVYVHSAPQNINDENGRTGMVEFYLEPGDYSNIELRTLNNYSYLTFKSDLTSNLLANTPYEIDIIRNKGVTFVDSNEDWEDDPDDGVYVVNPEDFLGCIVSGAEDYIIEVDENGKTVEKTILKKTSTGTLLRYNVSFEYDSEYAKRVMFEMPQGQYFDGGNHFIQKIASNLFESNHGTIKHLWLRDVRCDVTLFEEKSDDINGQWGLLCRTNIGTVENIRIDNFNIDFNIDLGRDNDGYTFDMGALIGNNNMNGHISDITYGETIRVSSAEQEDMRCTLYLGGLIGQNHGTFNKVKPMESTSTIIVEHSLKGEQAVISCGAAIGYSSTDVKEVMLPNVTVDCSNGEGLVGNTGGLVGLLRGTSGSASLMTSCTVAGTVKGLSVLPFGTSFPGHSYTGGLVGNCNNFDVTDCRSLCNVEVEDKGDSENVMYATGGGFGRLLSDNNISNNYVWGTTLVGPENYIGNFSGIVPKSKLWENYKTSGNTVKEIISGKFIGASSDENS